MLLKFGKEKRRPFEEMDKIKAAKNTCLKFIKNNKMEANKHSINVISIFKYMTEGFKIAKLKFPPNTQPSIGMSLKDSNSNAYIISGIVFENISDGIWDCKLNDSANRLATVSELHFG